MVPGYEHAKVLIGICGAILMGACVQPLQLDGRACGCAMGYVCCETTGVCISPSVKVAYFARSLLLFDW